MNLSDKENLYSLIRDYENIMGSSRTTLTALESLIEAIRELVCSQSEIRGLVQELVDVIKNTEPKIIPLIHLIEQFEIEIEPYFRQALPEIKSAAVQILRSKISQLENNLNRLVEIGSRCISDDDVIIVHSVSGAVRDILTRAYQKFGRRFRVLIPKQDEIRTHQLIRRVGEAGIDFNVIPEFNFSQYMQTVSKMFIGAISITPDRKIMASTGTAGMVGLCHLNRVPVYLFVVSIKFAHQAYSQQHVHTQEEEIATDQLSYRLVTHSHDLVDLDLVDHLITEKGEITEDREKT